MRWETAMKRLLARFPVLKWVSGSGEFTGSWSEQQADFSFVQSQKTYPTDVKPAETRRNEKPDDCATPSEIHNHLSTTQQGNLIGWADTARPQLPDQCGAAAHAKPHGRSRFREPMRGCVELINSQIVKLTFLSIPPSTRDTHRPFFERSGLNWTDAGWEHYLERPTRQWVLET